MDDLTLNIINKLNGNPNYKNEIADDYFYLSATLEILYLNGSLKQEVYNKLSEKVESVGDAVHLMMVSTPSILPSFSDEEL
jgi:hypothetical protein